MYNRKGWKLSTYQLILLLNAKKKISAHQLWLYYVFPELMGKLWKYFFLILFVSLPLPKSIIGFCFLKKQHLWSKDDLNREDNDSISGAEISNTASRLEVYCSLLQNHRACIFWHLE